MEWNFYIEPIVVSDEYPFDTEPRDKETTGGIIGGESRTGSDEYNADDEINDSFKTIPFFRIVNP